MINDLIILYCLFFSLRFVIGLAIMPIIFDFQLFKSDYNDSDESFLYFLKYYIKEISITPSNMEYKKKFEYFSKYLIKERITITLKWWRLISLVIIFIL